MRLAKIPAAKWKIQIKVSFFTTEKSHVYAVYVLYIIYHAKYIKHITFSAQSFLKTTC